MVNSEDKRHIFNKLVNKLSLCNKKLFFLFFLCPFAPVWEIDS
jgi:hypothetical protein